MFLVFRHRSSAGNSATPSFILRKRRIRFILAPAFDIRLHVSQERDEKQKRREEERDFFERLLHDEWSHFPP